MHITELLSNSTEGKHFTGLGDAFLPSRDHEASADTARCPHPYTRQPHSIDQSIVEIRRLVNDVIQRGSCVSEYNQAKRLKKLHLILTLLLSGIPEVQCAVLEGLCEICQSNNPRDNQEAIMNTVVVKNQDSLQLISLLLTSKFPQVQMSATRLVGALCLKNDIVKARVSTTTILPHLVMLLQAPDEAVQATAAASICCVVDDDVHNKNAAYRAGGMTALQTMIGHSTDTTLLAAVSCVGAIVTGFPVAQNAARNLGMVPHLVDMIYTASPNLIARIACCLAEIARDNSLDAKAIVSTGGIQAANYILNTVTLPEALFHALALLWCLCKDSAKRCGCARRVAPSLIPLLQSLTTHPHPNVSAGALLALRTLEQC